MCLRRVVLRGCGVSPEVSGRSWLVLAKSVWQEAQVKMEASYTAWELWPTPERACSPQQISVCSAETV